MTTYYASIGNSDNKLEQQVWSQFCHNFTELVCSFAEDIHGVFYTLPNSSYQSMCIGFELIDNSVVLQNLKDALGVQARAYAQDSITLAKVDYTMFLGPFENHGFGRVNNGLNALDNEGLPVTDE